MSRLWIITSHCAGFSLVLWEVACTVALVCPHTTLFFLKLCIKCGGQLQCFWPNCCYNMRARKVRKSVDEWACAAVITLSLRGEDDVAVKHSIKYSSGASQMSFFFPWAIGQGGWRGVSSAARQPMKSLACAHMSFSGQFLMTDIDVW